MTEQRDSMSSQSWKKELVSCFSVVGLFSDVIKDFVFKAKNLGPRPRPKTQGQSQGHPKATSTTTRYYKQVILANAHKMRDSL